MTSRSAIAWFERPSAINSITSRSRGPSEDTGVVGAALSDELRDDGRIESRAALGHTADRADELADL